MSKTILIMRHAKSSWATPGMDDHLRPLNKRGLRDAPVMGQMLAEHALVPDLLMYSSARRTEMTAALLNDEFMGEKTIGGRSFDAASAVNTPSLYQASWQVFLELMEGLALPDATQELSSVMLLAHNPGVEMLIEQLTGQVERMPTAAIAWLELSVDSWSQAKEAVGHGGFRFVEVWRPKSL